MNSSMLIPGIIISRSVSVPSQADAITYTIEIDEGEGHPVQYEGITPGASVRITTEYPELELELVPFRIGQEVTVSVRRVGSSSIIKIAQGEFPALGECSA